MKATTIRFTKTARQLTAGQQWNDSNPSFAPDGQALVFDSDRSGEEYQGGPNDDLWRISLEAPADDATSLLEPEALTSQPHRDSSPVWSPDGRWIAYVRTDEPYDQPDLFVVPAAGGVKRNLTAEFDRVPRRPRWSPDSRWIYFSADDHGAHRPFRLELASGRASRLLDVDMSVGGFSVAADRIALTLEDETRLAEVWVSDADGDNARQLTRLNRRLLDELALQPLEEIELAHDGGGTAQGFLIRPVGLEEGKRYPLVLDIKGGPGGMWGHRWFHEFQMMAGHGWAVAFVNYRGSTGYGDAHQRAVRLDYGGVDYRDNMALVDELLRRYDWIDPERLYVTGGSHGGFLTNWIVTQTGRFRAAVTQRSVASWVSEAGTQQYTPRQMRDEFGGSLWENWDLYWDRSPLKYANRVKTPTLVLHSDQDHICPIGQAQEWYFALKANGVETEMVIFKGENHSLSRNGRPVNLVERLRLIFDWFERHGYEQPDTSLPFSPTS